MKNDLTITLLNFVLAVLLVVCALCGYLSIKRDGASRAVKPVIVQVDNKMALYQSLIADVSRYEQQTKSPEVGAMLHNLQGQLAQIK